MEEIKVAQHFIKRYLRKIERKKSLIRDCCGSSFFFEVWNEELEELQRKLAYWKKRESKLLVDLTNEND
jgi:hypothetical protein